MSSNPKQRTPRHDRRGVICLSVDCLHLGFLGPYGNGWIETPTLDHLACESVVFDRFYVSTVDSEKMLDSGSPLRRTAKRLAEAGVETVLLTDDDALFASVASEEAGSPAGIFQERILIDIPEIDAPVARPEQTHFYRVIAETVRIAERCAKDEGGDETTPFFLWVHLSGFGKHWDFPMSSRRRYQAEEDPEPYAGITVPRITVPRIDPSTARSGTPSLPVEPFDPDTLQSIVEAYGGGVSVFDEALGGLIDALEEGELGGNTVFVLVSTRGLPLGEHDLIGWPPGEGNPRGGRDRNEREAVGPAVSGALYSETVHVPLFVRLPNAACATVRVSEIAQMPDIAVTVADWFALPPELESGSGDPENPGRSLVLLLFEETGALHEVLEIDGCALVTRDWFLRFVPTAELYAKPDDLWDVNDVAVRCEEIVRELLEQRERPKLN